MATDPACQPSQTPTTLYFNEKINIPVTLDGTEVESGILPVEIIPHVTQVSK
jgi:hypothetical protein